MELQAEEAAANTEKTSVSAGPVSETEDDFVEVTLEGAEEAPNDDKKNVRSIVLAEKEKLLTECKNQIQVCVYVGGPCIITMRLPLIDYCNQGKIVAI